MRIGGIQKTTLLDYPQKLACIVFLQGCNFRCGFCYSSELVFENREDIPTRDFFSFLEKRSKQLDGVVICGGEPTINPDLTDFCSKIKSLGYDIKLDTNGSNPLMLQELIKKKLIDYVAMDIKSPKDKYSEVGCTDVGKIEQSISLLKKGLVDYEFRTTYSPSLSSEDILSIVEWIKPAKKYYLQQFKPQNILDPKFAFMKPHSDEEIKSLIEKLSSFFDVCEDR